MACYRNETSCTWHHLNESVDLQYDIWLVNGNPNASHHNALELQFSFDKQVWLVKLILFVNVWILINLQNNLEISFLFLLIYVILVPLQVI